MGSRGKSWAAPATGFNIASAVAKDESQALILDFMAVFLILG